jgi:ubiquinone/menaquinone biosynthesis C-methylase UbiE
MDYIKRTKQKYNQLAHSNDLRHGDDGTAGMVVRFTTMLMGERVLDLGSGTGQDTRTLKRYGIHVQGLDISEEMIEVAKQTVNHVSFRRGDFRNLPYDDEVFDGIWANLSLVHLMKKDLSIALSQVHRVLKATGIFYASFLTQGTDGFIDDLYYSFYSIEELRERFEDNKLTVFDEVTTDRTAHLFARKQ